MKAIVLATKRHWSWKVFLVLVGLLVPAALLILPFEFSRQQAFSGSQSMASIDWATVLLNRLISILIAAALGGIGLLAANRIGLGMPFVEGWINHRAVAYGFRRIVAVAWIMAVGLVLSSFLIRTIVFDPPLNAMYEQLGITIPKAAQAPPLYGFLAAFAAGITEETLYRLFGLSLLAWLGGLLFHGPDGRPKAAVFWTANIVFSLAFGAAHLPTAASLGLPVNALVISSTLFGNGIAGLVFGWLFWSFGFESAMLGHFFADVILYALLPVATLQAAGTAAGNAATAGVAALILIGLFWAGRALIAGWATRQPQAGN